MLRSILKKYYVAVFVILMPCCSGMSNTPTYVLGTDMNYLQPTIQAIYSLMSSTRGLKRIIVLETNDVYGSEIEERSFRELCAKSDTQILRWNVEKLKNALSPELKLAYEKFCTKIDSRWRFETVAIRVLFPVLFNREVLNKTGYLRSFNLKPGEQFIDHFVWLDSDLVVNKSLLRFYKEFLKALKNGDSVPQITVSVEMRDLLDDDDILDYSKARTIRAPSTSGGVVAWNLDACRKLLPEKDLAVVLLGLYNYQNNYQDENFINTILKFWSHGQFSTDKQFDRYYLLADGHYKYQGHKFYIADKFFNIRPKDWIRAKLICNLIDFYFNPNDDTRNQAIKTWMSIYSAGYASDSYAYSIELLSGLAQEKIARRLEKLKSFLQEIELHNSGINKAEKERILNKLSNYKWVEEGEIAQELFEIANREEKEAENLLERCRDIMNNPVVIHWDQRLKPWVKIASVLLHNQQLRNQPNITLKTFSDLLSNDDYYLDITDLMWLNNLIKWLKAEGENGDIGLKQRNRILITQRWFESLINSQKRTFDQAIKILISSKEVNPSENYFKLAEKIWGKMHSVCYENDESSDKKSQLFEEISTLTGLPIEVWSDDLKSTIQWLYSFYWLPINDKEVPEEKREKVYRWLDSFRQGMVVLS